MNTLKAMKVMFIIELIVIAAITGLLLAGCKDTQPPTTVTPTSTYTVPASPMVGQVYTPNPFVMKKGN